MTSHYASNVVGFIHNIPEFLSEGKPMVYGTMSEKQFSLALREIDGEPYLRAAVERDGKPAEGEPVYLCRQDGEGLYETETGPDGVVSFYGVTGAEGLRIMVIGIGPLIHHL
ncbi:MAG TPA: hypothetical protein VI979_01285 [archaeon]|nr:hypothetical protein [archaeon]